MARDHHRPADDAAGGRQVAQQRPAIQLVADRPETAVPGAGPMLARNLAAARSPAAPSAAASPWAARRAVSAAARRSRFSVWITLSHLRPAGAVKFRPEGESKARDHPGRRHMEVLWCLTSQVGAVFRSHDSERNSSLRISWPRETVPNKPGSTRNGTI